MAAPAVAAAVAISAEMVMILAAAEVSIPSPPKISRTLTIGIAIPESVGKEVGIFGFANSTSIKPACEITTPLSPLSDQSEFGSIHSSFQ